MGDLIKQITNIQTLELLEERLGIRISGLTAHLLVEGDFYYIEVHAELVALDGGKLKHNVSVQGTASDSSGNVIGAGERLIEKENFFGLGMLHFTIKLFATDIQTLKVFPVKW